MPDKTADIRMKGSNHARQKNRRGAAPKHRGGKHHTAGGNTTRGGTAHRAQGNPTRQQAMTQDNVLAHLRDCPPRLESLGAHVARVLARRSAACAAHHIQKRSYRRGHASKQLKVDSAQHPHLLLVLLLAAQRSITSMAGLCARAAGHIALEVEAAHEE